MHLTTAQYQQFAQALERSFPSYVSLQQLVKYSMGQDLTAIVTTSSFSDAIFGLIVWADSQGRIDDLLNAAREAAPNNPEFQSLGATLAPLVQPLSRDQRNQLLRCLLMLPQLADRGTRNRLLEGLPTKLVAGLRRTDSTEIDLTTILQAVETWGTIDQKPAVYRLIDNALRIVPNSAARQDLVRFYSTLTTSTQLQPLARLTKEEQSLLVETLQRISLFQSAEGRNLLLGNFPTSLVTLIARDANSSVDITNIVNTVQAWGMLEDGTPPLHMLIQNALLYARHDDLSIRTALQKLDDILTTLPVPETGGEISSAPPVYAYGSSTRSLSPASPAQLQQLHTALLGAYSSREALKRMLRFGLNVNLASIAEGGSMADTVFDVIQWADSRGQVDDLISAAFNANPGNPRLRALAQKAGLAS